MCLRQCRDRVEDDVALGRGHAGGGLVEQQHLGLEPERDRKLDQALAAVGQFRDALRGVVGELAASSRSAIASSTTSLRSPAGRSMPGRDAEPLGHRDVDVLQHRQPAEQPVDLERARDAELDALGLRDAAVMSRPLSSTCPGVGAQHAGEEVDEGGLAGAVGADQRMARAGLEPEIDVARCAAARRNSCTAMRVSSSASLMARARFVQKRAASASQQAEHAVARKQRDQHQQQAEPELPGGRIDLRQEMRERHVGDRADERAVEPAVAAEHQHDQHGRGAVEPERAQVHVGIGLRPQAARDAGDRGRDRVAGDEPRAHRRADRVHAQHVLADAGEALPERRIDQRAHEQEADEQDAERVEILRVRIERIELEHAEQRRDRQAVEPVEAAGVFRRHVGRPLPAAPIVQSVSISSVRPVVRSSTRPEASPTSAATDRREDQAGDRLGPDAVLGQHPDRIGAGAEEGGVAERDDAGIAEREIEREREQDRDQQIGAEAEIAREREIERERAGPRAAAPTSAAGGVGRAQRAAGCSARRGSPARSCRFPRTAPAAATAAAGW